MDETANTPSTAKIARTAASEPHWTGDQRRRCSSILMMFCERSGGSSPVGRVLRFQKAGELLGFGHKGLGFGGRGDRLLHRGVFRAGKFAQGKRR